jgi:hypothetical protein
VRRLTTFRFVNRLRRERGPIASQTKSRVWLWSQANHDGPKLSTIFDFVNDVIELEIIKNAEPLTIQWIYGGFTDQKSKAVFSTDLILKEIRFKLLLGPLEGNRTGRLHNRSQNWQLRCQLSR